MNNSLVPGSIEQLLLNWIIPKSSQSQLDFDPLANNYVEKFLSWAKANIDDLNSIRFISEENDDTGSGTIEVIVNSSIVIHICTSYSGIWLIRGFLVQNARSFNEFESLGNRFWKECYISGELLFFEQSTTLPGTIRLLGKIICDYLPDIKLDYNLYNAKLWAKAIISLENRLENKGILYRKSKTKDGRIVYKFHSDFISPCRADYYYKIMIGKSAMKMVGFNPKRHDQANSLFLPYDSFIMSEKDSLYCFDLSKGANDRFLMMINNKNNPSFFVLCLKDWLLPEIAINITCLYYRVCYYEWTF